MPLFDDLETTVIADIARRVRKTMTYTRTAELMAMEMRKLGYAPNKIRTEVSKLLNASPEYLKDVERNTIEYKKDIKELIADIVAQAKEEGDEIVANSGTMSWIDDMRVWESASIPLTDDSFLPILVKSIQKQVGDEILNLSKTTGFKGVYGFESVENMYRRTLNSAVMQISSGTFDADTVIRKSIHELAQSGLRSIDYESGRSIQLDSAVKLAVRTGCAQLSGKMTDENILRTEQNLVQVSEHWGARNKGEGVENHEKWQGKVYYIRDEHDLAEEAKRISQESIDDLWEKTGYSVDGAHINNPLGLYGYNCRHRLYPFFEGVSQPLKFAQEPPPKDIDGKTYDYYAMTQKMRQLERKIRNLKREKEALKLYGADKDELNKVDVKIKEAEANYKDFCKKADVKPSPRNTRYEVGTSDLHKTQAYKEYISAKAPSNIFSGKEIKAPKRTLEEIQKASNEVNDYLNGLGLHETKWNGRIKIDNKMVKLGEFSSEDCVLRVPSNVVNGTLVHEFLHSRSSAYYSDEIYQDFSKIEEGSVQLFAEEVSKAKGWTYIKTYELETSLLREFNQILKVTENDFEFGKLLMRKSMTTRLGWLNSLVDSANINMSDLQRLETILNDLSGGMGAYGI